MKVVLIRISIKNIIKGKVNKILKKRGIQISIKIVLCDVVYAYIL